MPTKTREYNISEDSVMKNYRIISGTWTNLDHNNAIIYVEESEDGVSLNKFYYGVDFIANDSAVLHESLKEQIKAGEVELQDNIYALRVAGLAPLEYGTVLKDGVIYDKEIYKQMHKEKIRNRINELYEGYNVLKAGKNPEFKKNWEKKLDNLLAAEDSDELIGVDISEIEDSE
jgi:hypothetical protein